MSATDAFAAVASAGRKPREGRAVDLLVAATAGAAGLPLYTRNARDFEALDDLLIVVYRDQTGGTWQLELRHHALMDLAWVEVPAGRVLRGTPVDEIEALVLRHSDYELPVSYFLKEAPRSEVDVPAFAIARTPVTVGQWNAFCEGVGWRLTAGDPRLPIDGLAWWQAQAFCEWATEQCGEAVRLPTEDEWERAARGDDAREYPWGDDFEPRRANLVELGLGHALPVGSLPLGASPFGLLDMAGNVDEWTATEYHPYPGAPDGVPVVEPQAFDRHITRGGGFLHARDLARCSRRHGIYAAGGGAGFRVAAST